MERARFRKGEAVLKRATRDEIGTIVDEPTYDTGERWCKVQIARRRESIVEEDLDAVEATDRDPRDLVLAGRWGRIEAFRRVVAVERIRTQNRNTVYSFNAQGVLFEPHQYKPLLKFLDSIDRRMLIASNHRRALQAKGRALPAKGFDELAVMGDDLAFFDHATKASVNRELGLDLGYGLELEYHSGVMTRPQP